MPVTPFPPTLCTGYASPSRASPLPALPLPGLPPSGALQRRQRLLSTSLELAHCHPPLPSLHLPPPTPNTIAALRSYALTQRQGSLSDPLCSFSLPFTFVGLTRYPRLVTATPVPFTMRLCIPYIPSDTTLPSGSSLTMTITASRLYERDLASPG